jgi:GxxExxY protein
MDDINELTERIIGLAIDVHRQLGPGLAEAAYERALSIDLTAAHMSFHRQVAVPVAYKGEIVAEYRPDFIVDDRVVVEVKSIERLAPVHKAQMLTYLRITGCEVGLLMNFNEAVLKAGIRRVVLQKGHRTL